MNAYKDIPKSRNISGYLFIFNSQIYVAELKAFEVVYIQNPSKRSVFPIFSSTTAFFVFFNLYNNDSQRIMNHKWLLFGIFLGGNK